MKKYNRNLIFFFSAVFLLCLTAGCKKYFDPPLIFEKEPISSLKKDRKVLLISIDGLSGLELRKYMPPVMKSLLVNAKYTLDNFSDKNTGDASSWTTMLSGKSSTKHGVLGNSFEGDGDEENPQGNSSNNISTGYITVYQRLLESGRILKSLSVSPWNDLDQQLFNLSDENGTVSSDLAAKEKAVDRIQNGPDRLAFAVINFRNLIKVGVENGFSMDNDAYKLSLDEIDGYLGEIIAAVKAREKYATEDWLIIVTSNHGGIGTDYGGSSFEERKVPVIYYNLNFQPLELLAPQLKNSLRLSTKGNVETPLITATNSLPYDLQNKKEYTIMFKVFNNGLPSASNHAVVLGRTTHAYSANRGWHFMIEGSSSGNRYRCLLGPGSGTSRINVSNPISAQVNVWETVVLTLYFRDGKRYGQLYINGNPGPEVDVTGQNLETNAANFFIGSGNVSSIGTFNGKVNNLVFVDKVLSNAEIHEFACQQELKNSISYWDDIRGYWPIDEGDGAVIRNLIPTSKNTDFNFNASKHNWGINRSWNCFSTEENVEEEKKAISFSTDLLQQVFYWLNIKPATSWGLEGTLFLHLYEREFIGK